MTAPLQDAGELYEDQELIASRIDFFAETSPGKIVASIPVNPGEASLTYRDISVKTFAAAIDRTAHWLDHNLALEDARLESEYAQKLDEHKSGKLAKQPEKNFPIQVFAYDGPIDLRWLLFLVASIKTSRTVVFSHTHTSVINLTSLYSGAGCKTYIAADFKQRSPAIQQMKDDGFFASTLAAPELSDFLDSTTVEPYPYNGTWETDKKRTIMYFQSSGTTGPPKPIGHDNESLIYWFNMRKLARQDPSVQLSVPPGQRIHNAYHISHVSGCWWSFLSMVYWDTITVFSAPCIAASLDIVTPVLKAANVRAAAYPPSILAAAAKDPSALALLRKLTSISTGGMALDNTSAATIYDTREVRLQNNYGSTEMMIMPFVRLEQESWPYLQFHPSAGVELRPYTQAIDAGLPGQTNTIFEHVIVRDAAKFSAGLQPIFYLADKAAAKAAGGNAAPVAEYHSKDLFKRHPTLPDRWIYYGRTDDALELRPGHKVFVADMQRALQEDPLVAGCMIGVESGVLFAIVELHAAELARFDGQSSAAIDAVWPAVERANALCASGDRIEKRAVVLASPERPFLRFGKLSVDRLGTYALYKKEIAQFV